MITYGLKVNLQSYIAHPYWPEREAVINITKESGMQRARSDANRRKALEEYLRSKEMTLADWDRLNELANRQFYTNGDSSSIVVPRRHVISMLVATCNTARAAFRPCPPEQARIALRVSEWKTNMRVEDAHSWERFAVVSSGTGAKLSNQRGYRQNLFIGAEPPDDVEPTAPVIATGTITIDDQMVKPEVLRNALEWAGVFVGIGASRKMGWGRWKLEEFSATT
jgi:hypothetical protein